MALSKIRDSALADRLLPSIGGSMHATGRSIAWKVATDCYLRPTLSPTHGLALLAVPHFRRAVTICIANAKRSISRVSTRISPILRETTVSTYAGA